MKFLLGLQSRRLNQSLNGLASGDTYLLRNEHAVCFVTVNKDVFEKKICDVSMHYGVPVANDAHCNAGDYRLCQDITKHHLVSCFILLRTVTHFCHGAGALFWFVECH